METKAAINTSSTEKGVLQTAELYKYIMDISVYPREHECIKELRAITSTHPRAVMGTAPDVGQFMALLLKAINAKKTIEIGVFTGYSLLLTVLTIPDDGKITAIDMNRSSYEMGLPIIEKAGVKHKINFIESEALPVLDQLLKDPENKGTFDFAFVDADKDNYANYHERVLELLKPGGIVVYDNTLWAGTVAMDESLTIELETDAFYDYDMFELYNRAVMGTAPDVGQFMALLLKAINAKKTIEIGVFTGYSLLLTALTIPDDGKITAIDMNRSSYEMGLPIIEKAGVKHKINFIESEALPVLDQLLKDPENKGTFDFAFVDADKDNYANYHERVLELLKPGGIVVYDNTLWAGTVAMDESLVPESKLATRKASIEFNKYIAGDARVQISQVPLGDGITICYRN